jgi:dTDP-4-amino-4,6-dideoxy-D-glucose/dTDP-4-amino-2,4-dideoxy-beta-L-xylose transaminase
MREIPLFKVYMSGTVKEELDKVLYSGFIGQGKKVEEFEKNLSEYLGVKYLVTLNSGTSALHLALHLANIPKGSNVLTSALTCTATNFPIINSGYNIKWVDIDKNTLNMDLDDLERKIDSNTSAVILVNWGGYPLDLNRVNDIKRKAWGKYNFDLVVIEDNAHGFGTTFDGKHLGNHGNMVMYSLQAIKHITSGDGGILTLPNEKLYKRAKLLRWYGIDRETPKLALRCEDDIVEAGYKFHMNDINATIGNENLKSAEFVIQKHKDNAKFYDDNLKDINGIELLERHSNCDSSFWIYSLKTQYRNELISYLKENGIASSQVHERNDKHSCVSKYKTDLPNLDSVIGKILSIPVGWWVTKEDRKYIVDVIVGFFKNKI